MRSDPIADLLTRIRNASNAEHEKVDIPASWLKVRIAELLKEEGFIKNFRVLEDNKQGTLRAARMYEFLDRLMNIALPRVRDFKGVPPKGFDGRGNYALGLREQLIFPEIVYDKVDKVRGMDIIIVTTAQTDEEARALLVQLGMPFRES